jgi:hypothetical protein
LGGKANEIVKLVTRIHVTVLTRLGFDAFKESSLCTGITSRFTQGFKNMEKTGWPQNYWVFELCPSAGVLGIIEINVSETVSVSLLRWGGEGSTYSVGPLERANCNHWATPLRFTITM